MAANEAKPRADRLKSAIMCEPDKRTNDTRLLDIGHEVVSLCDRLRFYQYPIDIIRDMALVLKLLARVRRRLREERERIRVA